MRVKLRCANCGRKLRRAAGVRVRSPDGPEVRLPLHRREAEAQRGAATRPKAARVVRGGAPMIELARSPEEELAQLEADTRKLRDTNGASWIQSEPWEIMPAMFVACSIKVTNCRGLQRPKRVWLLNWRPIGHNALLGKFRDALRGGDRG
jgi:hypothetical protein